MLIVYAFFGTLVDVFIASGTSARLLSIKTKILFYTFVAPIMFCVAIIFVVYAYNKTIYIAYGCGLILASIIRIFSTRRMYLTNFQLNANYVTIVYLTHFFKSYTKKFNLPHITSMEVARANWLAAYPASVNIEHNNQWTTFEIIDRKLKAEVERDIAAANINIAASEAGR